MSHHLSRAAAVRSWRRYESRRTLSRVECHVIEPSHTHNVR